MQIVYRYLYAFACIETERCCIGTFSHQVTNSIIFVCTSVNLLLFTEQIQGWKIYESSLLQQLSKLTIMKQDINCALKHPLSLSYRK